MDRYYRNKAVWRTRQDCQFVWNQLEAYNKGLQSEQVKKRLSRNVCNNRNKIQKKFGIKIPGSAKEALLLDKKNGNNKWAEAILKEMGMLNQLSAFEYHNPGKKFSKEDGWQCTPMHMIFDIKHDLRYKAWFVVGDHGVDSSKHASCSLTVQDISIQLMLLIAVTNNLGMMAGNIGNAFCTAPCVEKIWSVAGDDFGPPKRSGVTFKRALYGLKTVSASFHKFLEDFLRELGFEPSRVDQDLWIWKSDEYEGYDYLATHVDGIIIVTKDPTKYMDEIQQHFL
eukprot:15333253-Ditylum_brightwellii.AAC.1